MPTDQHSPAATRIGVVTVSFGSHEVLPAFLDSVSGASDAPVQVIIADNKNDDTAALTELAQRHHAQLLPMTSNLGYGGAMNTAIAALPASVDWVLIANPDLVLGAHSIDTLVATGDSDPAIGSVGPLTLTPEGAVYPSARAVPSIRNGVGHALFANLWPTNPWSRAYRLDASAAPTRRDAGWLSGACVLVRKQAFDQIGGFDTAFFMYFEDVDLGYRLGRAGYRNVYEPDAQVTHTGAHATTGESARMITAHHDSARRFLNKKYAGPLLWPVRAVMSIGLKARALIVNFQNKRR